MRLRHALISIVTVASLAGCSSASPASESGERNAVARGVEVCIENNSSMQLRIQWRGFIVPEDIPPAASQCNSGYEYFTAKDMEGTLYYEPVAYPGSWLGVYVGAENHYLARPRLSVSFPSQGRTYGICASFSEGDSEWFQMDWLHVEVARAPDTADNKKFILNVTNSEGANVTPDVTNCVSATGML